MTRNHKYNVIEVGMHVEDFAFHKGLRGTVVEVVRHNEANPVSEHGSVKVLLDPESVGRFACSPPDAEHYAEYEWWKTLKDINA